MSDPVDALIVDLLEWIGPGPRPYAECSKFGALPVLDFPSGRKPMHVDYLRTSITKVEAPLCL